MQKNKHFSYKYSVIKLIYFIGGSKMTLPLDDPLDDSSLETDVVINLLKIQNMSKGRFSKKLVCLNHCNFWQNIIFLVFIRNDYWIWRYLFITSGSSDRPRPVFCFYNSSNFHIEAIEKLSFLWSAIVNVYNNVENIFTKRIFLDKFME